MVSDNTDADVCICVFFVCNTCHLADLVTKCLDRIYIKDRIYVLYDNCQTLESHTCINILLLKLCIVVVSIVIKLGKYVVPYFHITVTVTTDCTTRLTAAILFSTVIITSEHGPQGPAPCSQKLSSLPKRKIRSLSTPISLFQILNASSSSR